MAALTAGKVDWDLVDEELDRVPEEFKDPRFDSLRHVLDILSAVDAEAALEELKAQQETIEGLVDTVVQGYHSGFNKAIHNYSQILYLFSVAKDQIHKVRSQLEDSQRRLASQSGTLEMQWKKSVTSEEIVKLLSNIHGFVDIPQRLVSLQEAKDWSGAVAILLDACCQISSQEYSGIGALTEIKRELRSRRNILLRAVTAELEMLIYEDVEDGGDATGANLAENKRYSGSPSSSPRSQANRPSRGFRRHGQTTPRLINTKQKKLRELIDSATQMGGLAELQQALNRHSAEQLSLVILRALTEANDATPVPMQTTDILKKDYNVDPAAAKAAEQLMEKVLATCIQVFENYVGVLQMIGAMKSPPMTAGLEMLLVNRMQSMQSTPSGNTYVRAEAEAAWVSLQKEIQKLLTELLQQHGSLQTREYQANGVASNFGDGLSFSFDVQLQGVAARALLKRELSMKKWEGQDLSQLVQTAMAGNQGSAYLVPHVYKATTRFADEGLVILTHLEGEGDSVRLNHAERENRRSLSTFLHNFVENAFIPTIFMDFKTRCAGVLDDDESFRARAKPQAVYSKGAASLPAVNMLKAAVAELLQWAILMPTFSVRLTGILENMLGKVLAAFRERIASLVANSVVQSLLQDMTVSNKMGAAPSAPLAGAPVAFFTERNSDSVDNFVASIVKYGFGTGGEEEDIALLKRLMQERPIRAEQLLGSGDTSRCMNLAAIADSMDYLAEIIQGKVTEAGEDLTRSISGHPQTPRRRNTMANLIASPGKKFNPTTFLDGLDHMVDRFHSVAGQSLRALRLNMLLKVIHKLSELADGRFVCDPEEVQDLDDCIGALQRASSRIDEDVAPFLPARKREYVFEGMAAAAARYIMWMLPEIKEFNKAGVAKLSRILAVLQPFLAALGAEGGLFRPEAARHLEKARNYCAHLTYAPATLIASASQHPDRFTLQEWMALLEVDFHGRVVEQKHKTELFKVVSSAEKKAR